MTSPTGSQQPAAFGGLWLPAIGSALADLLFPPRCVACGRLGAWLCPNCLSDVEVIRPPVCSLCGWPLPAGGADTLCSGCQKVPIQLDGLCAYAFHSGPLRKAIHEFKYEGLSALAVLFGRLMAHAWLALAGDVEIDMILPVPLHSSRQRQRGYNQAVLLAREVGRALGHPVVEDALLRVKATTPQIDLNAEERRSNVQDAFRCPVNGLAGKRVLLIDDVCTTGSTLEAAASALRVSGVGPVWSLTLARARLQV